MASNIPAEVSPIWGAHIDKQIKKGWLRSSEGVDFTEPIDRAPSELESGAPPQPGYNGTLFVNPAGTIWQVIDGFARGFVSEALFLKLHYWQTTKVFNWGPWYNHIHRVDTYKVQLTPTQSINWIAERPPWNDDVQLVRNSAGTVCICETPRGEAQRVLYCVPSEEVMDNYQLDWDKVNLIADADFNSYAVRAILKLPDGTA